MARNERARGRARSRPTTVDLPDMLAAFETEEGDGAPLDASDRRLSLEISGQGRYTAHIAAAHIEAERPDASFEPLLVPLPQP